MTGEIIVPESESTEHHKVHQDARAVPFIGNNHPEGQKARSAIRCIKTTPPSCENAHTPCPRQKARSSIRCIKTDYPFYRCAIDVQFESAEQHKVGSVVAVCGAQHRQRGVLLSRSFVDRLFADG